jgi:hypothetical protein
VLARGVSSLCTGQPRGPPFARARGGRGCHCNRDFCVVARGRAAGGVCECSGGSVMTAGPAPGWNTTSGARPDGYARGPALRWLHCRVQGWSYCESLHRFRRRRRRRGLLEARGSSQRAAAPDSSPSRHTPRRPARRRPPTRRPAAGGFILIAFGNRHTPCHPLNSRQSRPRTQKPAPRARAPARAQRRCRSGE